VGEIAQSERVNPTQERPADAPRETVIDPLSPFLDVVAAWQSHGSPPLTLLTVKPWKVPRKNSKKAGVQVLPGELLPQKAAQVSCPNKAGTYFVV
jgi:hypothetical protein